MREESGKGEEKEMSISCLGSKSRKNEKSVVPQELLIIRGISNGFLLLSSSSSCTLFIIGERKTEKKMLRNFFLGERSLRHCVQLSGSSSFFLSHSPQLKSLYLAFYIYFFLQRHFFSLSLSSSIFSGFIFNNRIT